MLPIHELMLQRVFLQIFKYSPRNTLPDVIHELFITKDTFHFHNTRMKSKFCSKMVNREYSYVHKLYLYRSLLFGMKYKITSQLIHHTLHLSQIIRTIFSITI